MKTRHALGLGLSMGVVTMTRTNVALIAAAAAGLVLTVERGSAAPLNGTAGTLKEAAATKTLLLKAHDCHRTCVRGPVPGTPYLRRHRHVRTWHPCVPELCRRRFLDGLLFWRRRSPE
jgi:hypothetical protein